MERIIKFRCWSNKTNEYLSDFSISENGLNIHYGYHEYLGSDDFVLEQFTGQFDKNGNEIYEGDILTNPEGNEGFVRFDHGWAIDYGNWYSHDLPQNYAEHLTILRKSHD